MALFPMNYRPWHIVNKVLQAVTSLLYEKREVFKLNFYYPTKLFNKLKKYRSSICDFGDLNCKNCVCDLTKQFVSIILYWTFTVLNWSNLSIKIYLSFDLLVGSIQTLFQRKKSKSRHAGLIFLISIKMGLILVDSENFFKWHM